MEIVFAKWLTESATKGSQDSESEIVEGYSGRGMWGEKTTAISTNDPARLLLCGIQAAVDGDGPDCEVPEDICVDSLGLGKVIY
jgi:hypothetical protein